MGSCSLHDNWGNRGPGGFATTFYHLPGSDYLFGSFGFGFSGTGADDIHSPTPRKVKTCSRLIMAIPGTSAIFMIMSAVFLAEVAF